MISLSLHQIIYFKRNTGNVIFQNSLGNHLTSSTIRETIKEYCKADGVDYKGTHGFRHTHTVLMIELGVSFKYDSARLGYKTIKTTADIYLDITEKIEEDELQKFAFFTITKFKSVHVWHDMFLRDIDESENPLI